MWIRILHTAQPYACYGLADSAMYYLQRHTTNSYECAQLIHCKRIMLCCINSWYEFDQFGSPGYLPEHLTVVNCTTPHFFADSTLQNLLNRSKHKAGLCVISCCTKPKKAKHLEAVHPMKK